MAGPDCTVMYVCVLHINRSVANPAVLHGLLDGKRSEEHLQSSNENMKTKQDKNQRNKTKQDNNKNKTTNDKNNARKDGCATSTPLLPLFSSAGFRVAFPLSYRALSLRNLLIIVFG